MRNAFRLLVFLAAIAVAPAVYAQSSPPPNPNYTLFNVKADGDITTPSANKVKLFFNGTTFRFKNSSGTFTSLALAGGSTTFPLLADDSYSVNTPSYSRSGDANTGVGFPAADTLNLITGGTAQFTASTTQLTFALPLVPATDTARDIGDVTHRIRNLYLTGAFFGDGAVADAGISRLDSAFLKITDGGAGVGDIELGAIVFGGTTSSFPMMTYSGTAILGKLADDSDYATFQGASFAIPAYGASFQYNGLVVGRADGVLRFNNDDTTSSNRTALSDLNAGVMRIADGAGTLGQLEIGALRNGFTDTLTDNTLTSLFTFTVPTSNTAVDVEIPYTITVYKSGTGLQVEHGRISIMAVNDGGTVTTDISAPTLWHQKLVSGTLTTTFSTSVSSQTVTVKVTSDTSLAASLTMGITYRVETTDTTTVTP